MRFTRRDFLRSTGILAAAFPLAKVPDALSFELRSAASADWRTRQIPTICGGCKSRCLMVANTMGSKLIGLTANPHDPFTDGHLCAKGYGALKTLYDPDRLKYPLKRVGPRGKGQWRQISWGEAIDTVADNLEKSIRRHGPESVGLMAGGPSSRYIAELFRELGVQGISDISREFCRQNREDVWQNIFGGSRQGKAFTDFSQADCIVLFGSHFGENMQIPEVRAISKALARGAKLIVVDPRFSQMAAKADYHLMIRPGTDTALILGWIREIIENRYYNSRFVDGYTNGLAELSQQCREFTLKRAASLTDLALDDLHDCLDLIANSAPNVMFYPGNFSAWYGNDSQRLTALAAIKVLTSDLDSFTDLSASESRGSSKPSPRQDSTSFEIIQRATNGGVKFLGCWGQNPFRALPNPYKTMAAFEKVEFSFCCDIYPTETALYADIILPEATFLERMDGVETWDDDQKQVLALRYPTVSPMFEAKEPYWIVKQLSSRLGKGRGTRFDNVTERLDHDLRKWHLSAVRIRENGGLVIMPPRAAGSSELQFSTASGKIELVTDNDPKKAAKPEVFSFSALPPKGFSRLINGRSPVHSSSTANNPWLLHEVKENELWLNDQVAARMGIKNGEGLFLENQDGIRSISAVKIKVTPGIRVDCLFLAHGFGSTSPFLSLAFNRGINDGALMTRTSPDPLTAVRGIRGNFVRFIKNGRSLDIPQLDAPPAELRQNSRWWLDAYGSYERGGKRGRYV